MSHPADVYIAALSSPNDETIAALRPLLAHDVRAVGLFGSGQGREEVLASTSAPPYPLLAAGSWSSPSQEGDAVTVRATLPPGLPIAGVLVTMRSFGGKIVELIQELEMAPPPAETELLIDATIEANIDGALANDTPVIVAYVDRSGAPHVSFRGSVQSHGPDQLAMWIREPDGGLARGITTNEQVALLFRDPATRVSYEFAGRARVVDDVHTRDAIYAKSSATERNLDPVKRGVAVIVDVDRLKGGPLGAPINMVRSRASV